MAKKNKIKQNTFKFPKSLTGIQGLDDLTEGGLPKNRTTLLVGKPGSGKTVMAMEYLVNGIEMYKEPGVFMTFEEQTSELVLNVESFGYKLNNLVSKNKIYLEHLRIERDEIQETGKYDIEGLFVRLKLGIDKVKAKRVVLDSIDTLFHGVDYQILRSEFNRLFTWLKGKGVTAIITAEAGENSVTRLGLEEYVADCVIILDNRVTDQITTRRLRIYKYRGSSSGNNEYPFLIDKKGITVFPVISESIQQKSNLKRISTGIKQLDELLGKKGFFEGSSILISGTSGTGKTSIAASFAYSICESNRRCVYCAFEEAPNQVMRNMRSIGINFEPLVKAKLMHFYFSRPTLQNLELHFIAIKQMINEIAPHVVILDPVTNLMTEGPNSDIRGMLTRFVDYLKGEQITVMFSAAITVGSISRNPSDEGISSMVDSWITVQDKETDAERARSISIIKSRGMSHSSQSREFTISKKGITILPVVRNEKGNLVGSKRSTKEHEGLRISKIF